MKPASQPKSAPVPPAWVAPALIALAVSLAYANSFSVPFLLDDEGSIVANPTLGSLWEALRPPPGGDTVSGRPLLNVSFALSHALSGLEVWGYHLINVLIHAGAALLVFGLLGRTLRRAGRIDADWFALVAALLWALHPLQTESVTYIAQRAESLVAFFYLLTLYAFARSVDSPAPYRWQALTVGACALGMAAKEVMVSAPLLALLYDRTFVAGSIRVAWQTRRRLYLLLAATWVVLAGLLWAGAGRGGTAVAGGSSSWPYLLTQAGAIVRYLRLAILPTGQVFDYGTRLVPGLGAVWWQGLVVLALLGATGWALVRRPAAGFLGVLFFAVLAPSSSFLPVLSQVMAEHRMYLPLLSVILLGIGALHHWVGWRGLAAAAVAVPVLAVATLRRNTVYHDPIGLWRDTIRNYPGSDRAHNNLGALLLAQGDLPGAAAEFQEALRLRPDYLRALSNLAAVLLRQGDTAGGLARIADLLRLRPEDFDSWVNYARLLERNNRGAEAVVAWEQAAKLRPAAPDVRNSLGSALLRVDRGADAVLQFAEAVKLKPDDPAFLGNLGSALAVTGRLDEAVAAYNRSLALRTESAAVQAGLAMALRGLGRNGEAVTHAREALRIDPGMTAALSLLNALAGGQ